MNTKNLILSLLGFSLTSCAYLKDKSTPVTTSLELPITGIKLLVRGNDNMYDPTLLKQLIYRINDNQQLLIRYEKLKEYFGTISTDAGKKVEIQFSINVDTTADLSTLKLCPVVRNWTMHATWEKAHPFGSDGTWARPGGDYQLTDCVSPVKDGMRLKYDVTSWYINYARGPQQNLGLVLISPNPVEVAGDGDPTGAPRIFFQKWVR